MKEYPSIIKDPTEFRAHVFEKIDGSNIRVQFNKKSGFYKFGKRHTLLDPNDPLLGSAVDIFKRDWEEILLKKAKDEKWQDALLFFEFHGPNSFAGSHDPNDEKQLTLFDVCLNKQPMLGPCEFLKTFGNNNISKYLGEFNWNREFLDLVWNNELPGISFEGCVGKAGQRHEITRRKAKTKQWIDKVHLIHSPEEAKKISNS